MCRLRNIAKTKKVRLPRKHDYRTDGRTDRRRTKWSLCAAMLRRRHKNVSGLWMKHLRAFFSGVLNAEPINESDDVAWMDPLLSSCITRLTKSFGMDTANGRMSSLIMWITCNKQIINGILYYLERSQIWQNFGMHLDKTSQFSMNLFQKI